MEEKHRFVGLAGTGKLTVTELGADFRVSRKIADLPPATGGMN